MGPTLVRWAARLSSISAAGSASPRLPAEMTSGRAANMSRMEPEVATAVTNLAYALRAVHGPPYPELTIVLVPSKVQEARETRSPPRHSCASLHCPCTPLRPFRRGPQNIHRNCTVDAESGVTTCVCADERGWTMIARRPPSSRPLLTTPFTPTLLAEPTTTLSRVCSRRTPVR